MQSLYIKLIIESDSSSLATVEQEFMGCHLIKKEQSTLLVQLFNPSYLFCCTVAK